MDAKIDSIENKENEIKTTVAEAIGEKEKQLWKNEDRNLLFI